MSIRIFVPCDAAALSVGADAVAAAIIAEATLRGEEVELTRNGSRGMLWLEPLVEVEVDGVRHAYGPVMPRDVSSLFDGGALAGSDSHPLSHGPTEEIPFFRDQERLTFARCGITDPVSLDDYRAHGGFVGLAKARRMSPEAICAEVLDSGLRGRGGAGFPTGIKWNTVREAAGPLKFICCNADEGDSGTFADRMIMEGDPFLLIEGMAIAGLAVGASEGYIYLRSEYPHAGRALRAAIKTAKDAGELEGFHLEVRMGAGAYICGEETSMLESLEGKRGQVRAKPPLPALEGLFGKPTVVNNVLSLCAVPTILAEGGAFYKNYGQGRSRGTQPFQLAGNIRQGGLFEKAFGISLRELIFDYGGGTATGRPVRAVQTGGPLGPYVPAANLDMPMDYEAMAAAGGMLGHGGITVFDDTVDMAKQARFSMEFCAIESCGKCTPCRIGSQRGVETIDKIIAGEKTEKNLTVLEDLCELMRDGSLCAMGGLTPMPVKSAVDHFPEDFGRAVPRAAAE